MEIQNLKSFIEASDINFFFFEKEKRRGNDYSYTIHEADVEEISTDMRNQVVETLNLEKFNFNQVEFDTLLSEDDVLEVCNNEHPAFSAINEMINCELNIEGDHLRFDSNRITPQMISFYCIKFIDFSSPDSPPVYFFRRIYKSSRLGKGIRGYFDNNSFHRLDQQVFSFDSYPDVLVWGEEALILNRNSFSIIFDIEEFYIHSVMNYLNGCESYFQDRSTFERDCLQSRQMLKKMTKIAQNPRRISEVLDREVEVLREIINTNQLPVNISDDGKIMYGGDHDEMIAIANFISDAYYKTLCLDREGVEK